MVQTIWLSNQIFLFFFLCKCKGVKVYFKGFSFVNNKMFVDNWDALRIYNWIN